MYIKQEKMNKFFSKVGKKNKTNNNKPKPSLILASEINLQGTRSQDRQTRVALIQDPPKHTHGW